jgi:hypothetical protein
MWIDHLYVLREDGPGAMDEQRIGQLLAPCIARMPRRPRIVVDARPAAARGESATATYRLLAALGMPSATPVTVSFTRPDGVADVLESLLTIAADGMLLLVTVRNSAQSRLAACCLVSGQPVTANSVPLPERPVMAERRGGSGGSSPPEPARQESGDPFTDVMLALNARYGEALSAVPAQT